MTKANGLFRHCDPSEIVYLIIFLIQPFLIFNFGQLPIVILALLISFLIYKLSIKRLHILGIIFLLTVFLVPFVFFKPNLFPTSIESSINTLRGEHQSTNLVGRVFHNKLLIGDYLIPQFSHYLSPAKIFAGASYLNLDPYLPVGFLTPLTLVLILFGLSKNNVQNNIRLLLILILGSFLFSFFTNNTPSTFWSIVVVSLLYFVALSSIFSVKKALLLSLSILHLIYLFSVGYLVNFYRF